MYPGRELGFEAFFAFDLAHFAAARFTGVGLTRIFFFFPLKRVCREFIFYFGSTLLLMTGDVGAVVPVALMLELGPYPVDQCLVFEKGKIRLVVDFFGWLSLDDLDKI